MDDKNLMEDLLLQEKGVCDLYLHGSIESGTPNIHQAFCTALTDSLQLQNEIYTKMSGKGWYPTEQANQQRIDKVINKFSTQN
ncbi:spore coat protein [Feifania hominis]|uniref:Spore coat protein n=1 Tax=Feifania hominis TaxID=2763660 RepID=A0A926DDF3_9FIRM|nr:spore coat protein [Feifania hominis]MBC8535764.1 spore coat protein [Feifania hominis]